MRKLLLTVLLATVIVSIGFAQDIERMKTIGGSMFFFRSDFISIVNQMNQHYPISDALDWNIPRVIQLLEETYPDMEDGNIFVVHWNSVYRVMIYKINQQSYNDGKYLYVVFKIS